MQKNYNESYVTDTTNFFLERQQKQVNYFLTHNKMYQLFNL